MKKELNKKRIIELIESGELLQSIEETRIFFEDVWNTPNYSDFHTNIVDYKGRFNTNEAELHEKQITRETYDVERTKLQRTFINFVKKLPDNIEIHQTEIVPSLAARIDKIKMNDSFKYDIFLAHSSKNSEEAKKLYNFLRGNNLRVFVSFDDELLKSGHNWNSVINSALPNSQHFIVLATPQALQSSWVDTEINTFFCFHNSSFDSRKQRLFFVYRGENYDHNKFIERYPTLNTLQFTENIENVVAAIADIMEVVDNKKEKNEYKDIFESYAEQSNISDKQRILLKRHQKRLNLSEQIVSEIENEVWRALQGKVNEVIPTKNNFEENFTQKIGKLAFDIIFVKGGTFKQENRTATLSDFYIGKFPVTQKLWREVMGADPPELNFKGEDNNPVERVSWYEAVEFCNTLSEKAGLPKYYNIDKKTKDSNNKNDDDTVKWTVRINKGANGFRLLTEAEWEYAARGGEKSNGYEYAGSNNIDEVAWYTENSGSQTQPVGEKKPNELGIYDMSGNVWEWCYDWYGTYPSGSLTNPTGAATGSHRVYRGGGWFDYADDCRVSNRHDFYPNYRYYNLGFRVGFSSQFTTAV